MSSILNAWSISGAVILGAGGLLSAMFTKSVSGEGTASFSIGLAVLGGVLGLGAEAVYNRWGEPDKTSVTSGAECVKNAPDGYVITVGKDGTCTYAPR